MCNPGSRLSDETLLQICKTSADEEYVTEAWLADLRAVESLARRAGGACGPGLEDALTLLALVLGPIPPHGMPRRCSASGAALDEYYWIDRDRLEQAGKQIAGLLWDTTTPFQVARSVENAVALSISHGFLEQRQHDDWRPGMPSGSGRWSAVTATPFGVARARRSAQAVGAESAPVVAPQVDPVPEPPPQDECDSLALPVLDEDRMTVSCNGVCCEFPTRRKLLFGLLRCLLAHPGRRVSFETLKGPGAPWAGANVEASTIRSAVARLRTHLRKKGLAAVADAIHTMTDQEDGRVWLERDELEHPGK